MTDYTQGTNFTAKDALPSGHPSKKILGSLFDAEFNNISVAISTKLETGDSASFASGTVVSDFTFTDGNVTTASPTFSINNNTGIAGNLSVVGDIGTSGLVDGRAIATDGTKLDGIEAGATADQTDAEIKTAYENNADTNAYTDAEKTKLGTIETGADVTDATNVDAAGAVMNSDTSTVSMSFVIDDDSFATASSTTVPTSESVEARINTRLTAIGAVMVDPTPAAGQYARFKDAFTIEGVDLNVDPTLGTLTKTFVTNEQATITLSSAPTGQPVVSVSKEVPQTGTTNDYWDVSSTLENYTRTDSASGNLIFAPNIALIEDQGSFNVGTQDGQPTGVWFNADGTKMFVTGAAAGEVNEYALSTAYITTSASFTRVYSTATQDTTPESLAFNTDGTKMFVLGAQNGAVYEYTLSTGFNLTSVSFVDSFSVSTEDSLPFGLTFSADGTKMFVTGATNDNVYEYTLSTGFDVSTASYTQSFDLSGETANPRGVAFTNDGTVMFICSNNNDTIFQYVLTTGYDVSTASYQGVSKSITALDQQPEDIFIPPSEDYFIVVDEQNNDIRTYTLPRAVASTGGAWTATDVGKTIEASGGTIVLAAVDGTFLEPVAPSSYDGVASGNWEMYSVVYNAANGDLELSSYIDPTTAFSTASIVNPSLRTSFKLADGEADLSFSRAIEFNDDGTKLFIASYNDDIVYQYGLSAPYSTASAVYEAQYQLPSGVPDGITFSPDGTKMFTVDTSTDRVTRYDLGTPYSLQGTVTQNGFISVATEETIPTGVAFSTDGTVMIVAADSGGGLDEYSLSTAWDVTTASFVDFTLLNRASPHDLVFNSDGTKLFVIQASDQLELYTLSTPFDASTITYQSEYLTTPPTTYEGLTVDRTGTRIFLLDNAGELDEYYTDSITPVSGYHAVHTTTSTDSTYWTDINSMTADEAAGAGSVYYAVSTDDRTTWAVIDDTDGVRDIVRNNAGTWEYNSNATYGLETWASGTTNTELATLEEAMSVIYYPNAFDTSAASFVDSYVISEDTEPRGLEFNTDGTKMFVIGSTNDTVFEYDLSIAFDVSTASYSSNSHSVASEETNPQDISFNADGTKMFIVGSTGQDVNEYTLSIGFDLSSTVAFVDSYDVSTNSPSPTGVDFNTDGTKMFVVSNSGNTIGEYSLSIGFDVSTASFVDSFDTSSQGSNGRSVRFNTDGTIMAFITGSSVHEYSLSTGFDVSTSSFVSSFSFLAQDTAGVGLAFSATGAEMFVAGSAGNDVNEYVLDTGSPINAMDKTQLEAVTDANHYTLGNDLDLAIIFNQTASGAAPSSDGVSINYDANTLEQGAVLGTDYDWDYPASDKVRITALAGNNLKVRVV